MGKMLKYRNLYFKPIMDVKVWENSWISCHHNRLDLVTQYTDSFHPMQGPSLTSKHVGQAKHIYQHLSFSLDISVLLLP